jgi:TonB family protein
MTTSVAVVEGGKLVFEPSEITYRSIMYYLDANMMKMVTPTPSPATAPVIDAKDAGKEVEKNQTNGMELPSASVNLEEVNSVSAADLRTAAESTTASVPQVRLDSEPPPPTHQPILKPVSGGVLNGKAISLPPPSYPDSARRMRVSGTIVVEVVIDEIGKVIAARARSGPDSLADAAERAALRARFSPTKLSGQPVKVAGVINYKFTLAP